MSDERNRATTRSWMDEPLTLRGSIQVLAIVTAVIFLPFAIAAAHAGAMRRGSGISVPESVVAFAWVYAAFQTLILVTLLLLLLHGPRWIPDWIFEGAGYASLGSLALLVFRAVVHLGLGW